MKTLLPTLAPTTETELLERCALIEGLSFSQLASLTRMPIPQQQARRKGWAGQAIEVALGSTAGTKSLPDFHHLGIELKSIPLNDIGKPAESTFVTSIPLLSIHHQRWSESACYRKLKRVLWLPLESSKAIPFEQRRLGRALIWSPSMEEERILAGDWHELSTMIGMGKLEEIDASMGEYLQVRPKGASARSLCYGYDQEGNKVLTLPRGFYLRTRFTECIVGLHSR